MMTKRELFVTIFLFFISIYCFAESQNFNPKQTSPAVAVSFAHPAPPASPRIAPPTSAQAFSPATSQTISPASVQNFSPASAQTASPATYQTISPASTQAFSQTSVQNFSQASAQIASPATSRESFSKDVKFAYLTDLHISVGTPNVEDLENSVKDINSMGDIDFVIFGGDITEFGSDAEILLAKSVLDKLTCPYYILAGNHDSKWSESGCNTFAKVFGYESFDFEAGGVRFIGCNSGPNMRMAPALVPRESIVWLDSLTKAIPRGTPVIFVNHYPLTDEMLNYKDVLTFLSRTNIQLALCGHGHNNRKLSYPVPFFPAASDTPVQTSPAISATPVQTSPAISSSTTLTSSSSSSSSSSSLASSSASSTQPTTTIRGAMGRSNLRAGRAGSGYNIITIADSKITMSERMNGTTLPPWNTYNIIPQKQDVAEADTPASDIQSPAQPTGSTTSIPTTQPSDSTSATASSSVSSSISTPATKEANSNSSTRKKLKPNRQLNSDKRHNPAGKLTSDGRLNPNKQHNPEGQINSDGRLNPDKQHNPEGQINSDGRLNPYKQLKPVWVIQDNTDIGSGATYSGGIVYYANTAGVVKAVDSKNGNLIWSYKTGGKIFSTPALSNGKLVIGCTDGYIYCLDAKGEKIVNIYKNHKPNKDLKVSEGTVSQKTTILPKNSTNVSQNSGITYSESTTISQNSRTVSYRGKLLWKVKANKSVLPAPAIYKGIVYIGASDGIFRALRLKDGSELWSYNGIKGFVEAKAYVDDEGVYIGDWRNTFYAFNPKTGRLLWTWTNKKLNRMLSPAAVWPVKAHGKVFIVTPERVVYALNAADGKEIWSANGGREAIGLSSDGKAIYIKTMQDSVFAWSTVSNVAKRVWSSFSGYGYEIAPSPITTQDGLLFIPTDKGNIFALRESDGKVVWSYNFSIALINYIQPLGRHRILVSSMDGKVGIISGTDFSK